MGSSYFNSQGFIPLSQSKASSNKMVSDAEYLKIAEETYKESIKIVKSDGWKVEKEDKVNNVVVEMKKNEKGRKIYRCTAKIPMPAKLLVENIRDTDKVSSWNYTLTEARVLKKISDTVAISYQITTDAAGGMVSARDFIYLWLMDCEYKGMMLQSILDIALPIAQTSFVECIKKLGAKLQEEGRF